MNNFEKWRQMELNQLYDRLYLLEKEIYKLSKEIEDLENLTEEEDRARYQESMREDK